MRKMIRTIRSVRTQTPTLISPTNLPSNFGSKASVVRFRQVTSLSNKADITPPNMDKEKKPNEKTGDVMSHSFGEGYATRSDEEGFGGVYGGNQSILKTEEDQLIHENHPAYDKTQGSEVKEKEKARNQPNESA
ncbi:hypothetical protein FNV43_RR19081 [Rhamnella rubrinervis]|uniref:Uncharacterized protein n=1 Tax=Rhamnella rubrinervis TaxID=2594499 RepID=A0A8K0E0I4_9ROSA|nr:hypothetical protein FNV43_RR19081 [Rhamnella rubrinervis]